MSRRMKSTLVVAVLFFSFSIPNLVYSQMTSITSSKASQVTRPQIVNDGAGGSIVVWPEYNLQGSAETDIYVKRLDPGGNILWTTVMCSAPGNQRDPQVTSDGLGGAIITWVDTNIINILDISTSPSPWAILFHASDSPLNDKGA